MTSSRRKTGTVHLVGAGPGDPGLITVRGRDRLSRADVVVCDALASRELLDLAPAHAERIHAGRRGGRAGAEPTSVHRLMIDRARRGLDVVHLKGGDPSLFGRVGEEAKALRRARVPFEIVPGVTAALGAAAFAGIPLTDRRHASAVTLATGHLDPGKRGDGTDWEALARSGTLVLYMVFRRLAGIVKRLVDAGMAETTPVALVRRATLPEQEILVGTLADIAARARAARFGPPALFFAGNVVRLRRVLDWRSRLPLNGRSIVITRPRHQAAPFAEALRAQGATVLLAPAIELVPPRTFAPLDRALARLGAYDAVIFTSANGVARFFARLDARRADVRDLKGVELIAIGPATAAAVAERGLRVAVVPEEFRAEGIVRALARRDLRGARVLIPRATVARDVLVRALRERGADVEVVPVYRTVRSREGAVQVRAALRSGRLDLVTFTSSSTVSSFAALFRGRRDARRIRKVAVAAIGPITAATARREGFRVMLMPKSYTVGGLTEAIVRRFRNSPSGTPRGT